MKNLKDVIRRWGTSRTEGPSEAEGKRRQVNVEKLLQMERPGSLVRVVGYISHLTAKRGRRL